MSAIDTIAVTAGPGLIGSLLVGVNTAKTLAFANSKPIMPINHWLGHIYSTFSGAIINDQLSITKSKISKIENCKLEIGNLPQFPLLALIVSGGHTGLVIMRSHTDYEQIGETLDDAAGEAFDKVAKLLDLGYPGGPAIAAAAAKFRIKNDELRIKENIIFPRAMLNSGDYNFSFSGLKTAVLNKVKYLTENCKLKIENFAPVVAHEFQQCVIDILIGKTLQAAEEFRPKSILLCGGVSANKELREQMASAIEKYQVASSKYQGGNRVSFHVPPMTLTGDNAAMIGIAAAYQLANGIKPTDLTKIDADSNLKL